MVGLSTIDAFRAQLAGRPVAVVGAGISGRAAAELLVTLGLKVTMLDDHPDRVSTLPDGVSLGPLVEESLVDTGLVVLSPGVPRTHPALRKALAAGRLIGEVELASRFLETPLIGVTGTNGKSTTTALLGHILQRAGRQPFIGGNFGTPLSELVTNNIRMGTPTADIAVVELSSYQLESIDRFQLQVGVWLNIEPDHLDRYPDYDAYIAAKARILQCVGSDGLVVASRTDAVVSRHAERLTHTPVRWFHVGQKVEADNDGTIVLAQSAHAQRGQEKYALCGPGLLGEHNYENAAAGIEVARFLGISPDIIQRALADFSGLNHRMKLVAEVREVRWYNDSKATNISAAVRAIHAMNRPTVLIVGGRDKGGSWQPLVRATEGRVSHVLSIGEASPIIVRAFTEGSSKVSIEVTTTLESAVHRARELAEPGYAVLLSPACASFDQFSNYAERGDTFARLAGSKGSA